MPIQTPQWTEVLSCPVCCKDFSPSGRQPVSLSCGHTVCRMCLGTLPRHQCPFDQTAITREVEKLPTNYAILQLVAGSEVMRDASRERVPDGMKPAEYKIYRSARQIVEELALHLRTLNKASTNGLNSSISSSSTGSTTSSSGSCQLLSRPIQRKLVTLVNCQLVEEEGRARAVRAARSLGERIVTELIVQHQNPQQLSTNLWAAVRARGCQFLGPAMQEETLKLVLLALEDGTPLSRKVLVLFVVQKLEQQFPQASKTSVGHVVQLLYRASCFKVTKREEESSLMQLKEEFRNYDSLRREHDAQIVQIALEAGLRISPEQWSSLLYGDLNHKSHMQSIIDKLQTPASFASSIEELTICLQRSGDPVRLAQLRIHLEKLAKIDPSPGAMISSWEDIMSAMDAVKKVVQGLVDFMQNYSQNKKAMDLQTQNIKYKTSMCRDIMQKGGCPRGPSCTFAHSEEELEKYRAKSRQLVTALNNQSKNPKSGRREIISSLPDNPQELLLRSKSMTGKDRCDSTSSETQSWAGPDLRLGVGEGLPRFGPAEGSGSDLLSSVTGTGSSIFLQTGLGKDSLLDSGTSSGVADDTEDKIQESLRGLSEGLTEHRPASPAQERYTPASELPASNRELYLANLGMKRGLAGDPPQGEADLGTSRNRLVAKSSPRLVPAESTRYSSPPEDGYYIERKVASRAQEHPKPKVALKPSAAGTAPPAPPLQPRILIPTNYPMPRPKQPMDYHERDRYIAPIGGRYLYPMPTSPLPNQRASGYRRPVIQRYVDPTTMKAYDVVPADCNIEPSAPPESLLPRRDYEWKQHPLDPRWRDPRPDYYSLYDQHAHGQAALHQGPAASAPLLIPSHGRPDYADSPEDNLHHGKPRPSKQVPPPMHPLKVERGPSLTELREKKDYLVNKLDEIQGDADNPPTTPSASSTPKLTKLTSQTSNGVIWPTFFSPPNSASSLGLQFKGITDDDDDDDHDHRNNGIDIDAEVPLVTDHSKESTFDSNGQEDRSEGDVSSQGSYNPWTSTSLFTPNTGKAVKETATNYTMTYSKVLVRHVSANETEEQQQTPVQGTHTMQDFKDMSMDDLKRTLNQVKQQDQRAGCSHFERGTKIQLEMERREEGQNSSGPITSYPPVPLPAQLAHKDPILHLYSRLPKDIRPKNMGSFMDFGYSETASRSARSMGRNTGPLKVSAGMEENTTPVNITMQDCQVAPGFQTSNGEGYSVAPFEDKFLRDTTESGDTDLLYQDDWEQNVAKLVECDPRAEEKLKQALDQVSQQIQAKETVKHARNTMMLDIEEKALENMQPGRESHHSVCNHGSPSTPRAEPPTSVNAFMLPESPAIQLQERSLARYSRQPSHHQQDWGAPLPPTSASGQGAKGARRPWPDPTEDSYYSADPTYRYGTSTSATAGATAGAVGLQYADRGAVHHPGTVGREMRGLQSTMASKQQMLEATDQQIARELQNQEQQEYLEQMRLRQRQEEAKQREAEKREQQELYDRRLALDMARREAMRRTNYSYYPY
ncbi:uncharacterized protein [Diadema setosum]|uniref:uncharacterized protein n=1 Tax=Diadema setosum TaxID=31175 RepID=UPI003B3B5483